MTKEDRRIFYVFVVLIYIGFALLIYMFLCVKDERNQCKTTIENAYSVEICNDDRFKKAYQAQNEASIAGNTYFFVKSLDPNDDTEYKVFLVKQDDTWQLCRRNNRGEYIALDPEHTIQDLKENS